MSSLYKLVARDECPDGSRIRIGELEVGGTEFVVAAGPCAVESADQMLRAATGVVSAGALVAVVQTPGVSQFFGCVPLGPVAWAQAAGSAGVATAASVVGPRLVERYGPIVVPEGSPQASWLERLEEVREEATRRYLELQERAAEALNG